MTDSPTIKGGIFGLYAAIKYKLSLDKEIKEYNKKVFRLEEIKTNLDKKAKELIEYNNFKITEIENISNPENKLIINLISSEIKEPPIKKLLNKLFKNEGYILYINKANELKFYSVRNFKYIYNIDTESYGLNKVIGTYNGKPIFLVKYPYAISLDLGLNNLAYDSPTFYNYVNKVTKQNLTNFGSSVGLGEWIKKNFLLIIIGIALILLFTTPQGKQFLAGILPKNNLT